jgi:hypothetical protein
LANLEDLLLVHLVVVVHVLIVHGHIDLSEEAMEV